MLQPIENGEYLDAKINKYSTIGDYEIQNNDVAAVFVDSVSPANFIAKFQFVHLCNAAKLIAHNYGIKFPVKIIREATAEDDNIYPIYAKDRIEKKFVVVVILGECDEKALDLLRNDENAMNEHQVAPGSGVFRKIQ